MITEIFLALVQAATEFLPISSSGHLALISNTISEPDLFFFTSLHLASLIAVIIFTRKEIMQMLKFDDAAKKMWICLIVATIPAGLFGFFFNNFIEETFSSYLFLAGTFFFTGVILLLTRLAHEDSELNVKNAFVIGVLQILALFPGVSRSGITISSGMFLGVKPEKAARFSFLLLIPLALGAFVLEAGKNGVIFSVSYLLPFLVCLVTSLVFLNVLMRIIVAKKFWWFAFYCFLMGLVSLVFYLI